MTPQEIMDAAISVIRRHAFRYRQEVDLHERLMLVLTEADLDYRHEHRVDLNRFDLFLTGGIVLEVKVGGSRVDALRQASRYCECADVTGVLIVASTLWGRTPHLPILIHGKPLQQVFLQRDVL